LELRQTPAHTTAHDDLHADKPWCKRHDDRKPIKENGEAHQTWNAIKHLSDISAVDVFLTRKRPQNGQARNKHEHMIDVY
jgi:hypothetical protein